MPGGSKHNPPPAPGPVYTLSDVILRLDGLTKGIATFQKALDTAFISTHNQLEALQAQMSKLQDEIDSLKAEVAKDTTVMGSAATLIAGIPGMIQTAVDSALASGATPEQLAAITDLQTQLAAAGDPLAAAVAANTPGQPAPAPGGTPGTP